MKVKYEPKQLLLCDRQHRKQQQRKFEILQFSEESYVVSVIICVIAMWRIKFYVHRTNSIWCLLDRASLW